MRFISSAENWYLRVQFKKTEEDFEKMVEGKEVSGTTG